ncbi:MAG: hypothetical protein JWM64_841 [Frankiales bacterium]|nr:hypothetical protein [Frankiales bacterium]
MRVLITGMSGTGKSSVVAELRRRGYSAFDVDEGYSTRRRNGVWHWDVEAVARLLADRGDELVFLAGCSEEQGAFRWDQKVVLTVPEDLLLARLATRASNEFGKDAAERERVLSDRREFEPVLVASADLVLDTRQPLTAVVDAVLALVHPP